MGGSDKGLDIGTLLKEIPKYCKAVILLSGSGTETIKNKITYEKEVDSLKKAVGLAKKLAVKGDIILLSPAFASFGMFENEYDRGDQFAKLIKSIK
jgi:UDP-N-acetylmuramoylalanine--D-glutamate ligase